MQIRGKLRKTQRNEECSPGRLQKRMILWTFVLAVGLGVTSFFVLVQPPRSFSSPELASQYTSLAPYSASKNAKAESKPDSKPNSKSDASKRSPASVATSLAGSFESSAAIRLMNDKDQALEIEIGCADYGTEVQKKEIDAKVSHVRLTGVACPSALNRKSATAKSSSEIVSSEIRNDSNGFTATVFYPKLNKFTTDYIGLRAGLNTIHVIHNYKKGEREEHTYILRRL